MYSDVRYSTFVRSLDSSVLESLAGCLDQVVVEFIVNKFVPVGFVPLSCILYWSPNLVNRTYSNVVGSTKRLLGISSSEQTEAVHASMYFANTKEDVEIGGSPVLTLRLSAGVL